MLGKAGHTKNDFLGCSLSSCTRPACRLCSEHAMWGGLTARRVKKEIEGPRGPKVTAYFINRTALRGSFMDRNGRTREKGKARQTGISILRKIKKKAPYPHGSPPQFSLFFCTTRCVCCVVAPWGFEFREHAEGLESRGRSITWRTSIRGKRSIRATAQGAN